MSLSRLPRAGRRIVLTLVAASAMLVLAAAAPVLSQSGPARWWRLDVSPAPTTLQPGQEGQIGLSVTDVGDAPAEVTTAPAKVTDTLSPGLKVVKAEGKLPYGSHTAVCVLTGTEITGETVTCTYGEKLIDPEHEVLEALQPFEVLQVNINVQVNASPGLLANTARVEGGGAAPASNSQPIKVGNAATPFGVRSYELMAQT